MDSVTWQRFHVDHSDNDGFQTPEQLQKLHPSLSVQTPQNEACLCRSQEVM